MPQKRKVSSKRQQDNVKNEEEHRRQIQRSWRKRGGLENMPNMPLDIIMEIMNYLMPMDILNLARTSKSFRAFLMVRSAAPLWRAARQNVDGLPECPDDLSEPAYANLTFDSHCYECGQAGTKLVLWALRVKFCPQCRKEKLTRCANHRASVFTESCDDLILPYTRADNHTKGHWHLPSDVIKMTDIFDKMSQQDIEAQQRKVKAIMDHAAQCMSWQDLATTRRLEELKCLREKRLHAVVERLRALGWEHELNSMGPNYNELQGQWDVDKAQELTERSWNMIKGSVIEHMESLRFRSLEALQRELHTRRAKAFVQVFRRWHAEQPDKRVLPRAVDFMRRPEIQSILRLPDEISVTTHTFNAHRGRFADWTTEWRHGCEDKLRTLIRSSDAFKDKITNDTDPLSLASVMFTCPACEKGMPETERMPALYPSLISHDCLWPRVTYHTYNDPVDRGLVAMSGDCMASDFREAWDCTSLSIGRWHERAKDVIQLCGKDPYTTKLEEMDALDVCRWREVFFHNLHHDRLYSTIAKSRGIKFEPQPVGWRVMSSATVAQVKEIETRTDKAWSEFYRCGSYYYCCHCSDGDFDYEDIKEHLMDSWTHRIPNPQEGRDFYITPDAEVAMARAVLLIKPSRAVRDLDDQEKKFYDQGTAVFCDYIL